MRPIEPVITGKIAQQVRCPECDHVMLFLDDWALKCVTPKCKYKNIVFEAPRVQLIERQG